MKDFRTVSKTIESMVADSLMGRKILVYHQEFTDRYLLAISENEGGKQTPKMMTVVSVDMEGKVHFRDNGFTLTILDMDATNGRPQKVQFKVGDKIHILI